MLGWMILTVRHQGIIIEEQGGGDAQGFNYFVCFLHDHAKLSKGLFNPCHHQSSGYRYC